MPSPRVSGSGPCAERHGRVRGYRARPSAPKPQPDSLPAGSSSSTRSEPDFVETFRIALAEKMLAGGGPVITTLTGGSGEAVGDTAVIVAAGDVQGLAHAMDRVVLAMPDAEREGLAERASTRWPSIVCVCVRRALSAGRPTNDSSTESVGGSSHGSSTPPRRPSFFLRRRSTRRPA
jgi:hypothetical protein